MRLNQKEIEGLERKYRLNLINSITGIKPANLLGTVDKNGQENLAIISSVVHLGSNPALIGFVMRPHHEVRRDSYHNIMETGFYTLNHVPIKLIKNAHYTSAKFPSDISEFDCCEISKEYCFDFFAPFVKESPIKIGLGLQEKVDIKANGTCLMIGKIEELIIEDQLVNDLGYLNLEKAEVAGISGLNSYYSLKYLESFPYARPNELPNF